MLQNEVQETACFHFYYIIHKTCQHHKNMDIDSLWNDLTIGRRGIVIFSAGKP